MFLRWKLGNNGRRTRAGFWEAGKVLFLVLGADYRYVHFVHQAIHSLCVDFWCVDYKSTERTKMQVRFNSALYLC